MSDRLPAELVEDLEILAMEAMRGQAASTSLAWSMQRDVTALLHRYGYTGAKAQVSVVDGGLSVVLLMPAPGRRVERVVLQLSRG